MASNSFNQVLGLAADVFAKSEFPFVPRFLRNFAIGVRASANAYDAMTAYDDGAHTDRPSTLDTRAWARSVTKVVAFSESQSAGIVGIASDRRGAGVSLLAREVAGAYANFGRKTLLVDASRLHLERAPPGPDGSPLIDLSNLSRNEDGDLFSIDLAELGEPLPSGSAFFRSAFEAAARDFSVIVVDLPPVTESVGKPTPAFMAVGAACDLVFLVCLTGVVTQSEFNECIQDCKICGIKVGALILNDWKLMAASLLADK